METPEEHGECVERKHVRQAKLKYVELPERHVVRLENDRIQHAPVSYTHLDVYKRQGEHGSRRLTASKAS